MEILCQPLPHLRGKPPPGRETLRYHTGYRAFSRELLQRLPLEAGSDDFVFDNQVLAQVVWLGETIAEVSCPTRYEPESSSINFKRSVIYGLGCLRTAMCFRLVKLGLIASICSPSKRLRIKDEG